ncbi:ACP S-malonyltransferase, partial [Streptomyces sparsus]
MGAGLAGRHPDLVDAYYRQADTRLGFPLSELCWQGPGHVLRDASVSEPAVLLTSVVTLEVLRRSGLRPDVVAGHGLGEYTALVAAGSLHWTDALRLVRLRGQLTSLVTERAPGATLDVAGVPTARLVSLCA